MSFNKSACDIVGFKPLLASFAAAAGSASLPPVLDACCSNRGFWFNKQDPRAIFMDKRAEKCPIKPDKSHPARILIVRPDVVADFKHMPFPDDSFWHVVFDPPHARFGESSVMAKTYGTLCGVDWREMLRGGFSECFRVLRPNGTLIFKWCEYEIPIQEVLKLSPHPPLYGHISGKRAQTHWCTFLKPVVARTSLDNAPPQEAFSGHVSETGKRTAWWRRFADEILAAFLQSQRFSSAQDRVHRACW
jgi:SAM-dependent methyltransferase